MSILIGSTPQSIKDNRDILLTQWRRIETNPITPLQYTFGNIIYDPLTEKFRQFEHGQLDNKIYQSFSTNTRVFGERVLALDLGTSVSWDDTAIGVPYVWYEAGETRPYRMMYRGQDSGGVLNIGLATSIDGDTWERKDTDGNVLTDAVLKQGDPGLWDGGGIDFGGVIKVDTTYYLYYNRITATARQIGLAISTDLVTWTKDENNPLYIRTVGADIDGATEDTEQGRFCADIVRWDKKDGTVRYVMFVPHYIAGSTTPELEVYTCPNPEFYRADRTYIGTMFRTATMPYSEQNGTIIAGSGTDTPRIITDDITRNVNTTTITGDEVLAVVAMNRTSWTHELLSFNKYLPGKLEPDGVLSGCKFTGLTQDFPVDSPVIRLEQKALDANTKGLWIPSLTGSWCDVSGNKIHLTNASNKIDSNGSEFLATQTGYANRLPTYTTDTLVVNLESIRVNQSVEFSITLKSHFTSGIRSIYAHSNGAGKHHTYIYMTGGEENYKIDHTITSGGSTRNVSITIPVASFTLDTKHKFAFCKDGTNGKLYVFMDGTLLNAGGTNYNYAIDDLSAQDPPVKLAIGSNNTLFWDGYIDQVRVSDICRYTANYTPADFTHGYTETGTIFTDVWNVNKARKGSLQLLNQVIPSSTSITVKARNASDIDDQSVTAEDFTLDNPTGQYHQYLITFATTDTTLTPSITGAIPRAY